MTYQLTAGDTILRLADNAFIPPDPANTDYQAYLAWLDEGNTPDPAPPPDPANTDYQAYLAWLAEGNTPEPARPLAPEPDWTAFNLAMIPPTTESTFEVWLNQFKEPYRVALTVASSERNVERVQEQYNILKEFIPPTSEQIAEWQELADTYNISLTF